MTTLEHAHREWAERAPDERFGSLIEMHERATQQRERALERSMPRKSLHVIEHNGDVVLGSPTTSNTAALTHFSFGQLARQAGAPAEYLRTLSSKIVCDALNEGFDGAKDERTAQLLLDHDKKNKRVTLRAVTSEKYSRIWHSDVTQRLLELEDKTGWRPAPAAFDGSRGLYLGDRDMFAFMVDNERRIFETKPGGGLGRGFFAWNAEGGGRSFGILTFLYEYICGNHRVWGAQEVSEKRVVHVGDADLRSVEELQAVLLEYAGASARRDEDRIRSAEQFMLGTTRDEVVDFLFGKRLTTRVLAGRAADLAETRRDWYGEPRSAWGIAGAITEVARDLPCADERVRLDRAAGKLMELAF